MVWDGCDPTKGGVGDWLIEEVEGAGFLDGLGAAADVEFAVDVVGVPFDGAEGYDEVVGDLLVGVPGRDEMEYFEFAVAEGFYEGLLGVVVLEFLVTGLFFLG